MLHNRQSDERGSLKWQLQPVKVLFSTFYTWGMSTRTRPVYALKVTNSWHVHTLPSGLTQPVSAQRKELSPGKELQSLENASSRIFCIGSWIHFLCRNRTGFKKIVVYLQRALKVISRYMKHVVSTRTEVTRSCSLSWETVATCGLDHFMRKRIINVSAMHKDWVHRDIPMQLNLVL